jgi:hypothetical protein
MQETEGNSTPERVSLAHGRTLTVSSAGGEEVVEIRASSGAVELRLRMTPEGPVLVMECVRISLKAAESVDVECKQFQVNASQSIEMKSQGGIEVSGKADVRVEANGELRIKGEMLYLN